MPETVTVPSHASVSMRLVIPELVYSVYTEQADASNRGAGEVIAERVARCKEYNASRPLYFNDEQRGKLEALLGGRAIGSPEAALQRIADAFRVRLNNVSVQIDANSIERIKSRNPRGSEMDKLIPSLISNWVRRYLQGEL